VTLSFVIPAHDEAALLPAAIDAIRRSADDLGVRYEIIVADDASTDRTAAVATANGARVVPTSVRQIAGARNAGARTASGETLVFVDADTLVSTPLLRAMVVARRAGAIGGGAVVQFDQALPRFARVWVASFTWFSRRFKMAAGCFVFVARDVFEAVGGFDESYFDAEEIALSRTLGRRGRFVILPETVVTSARKLRTHSAGEIWRNFLFLTFRPRAVKRRSALGLWYGPRRPDKT